jgi:uroporphyrin-III C-methyltransferase
MNEALAKTFARLPRFEPGHVWLAGAGPGDPGMLTLQAVSALQQADVIVHDALVSAEVLALADPDARLEFAGKRGGLPSYAQSDITARLIGHAYRNRRVLRLKGGDPCLFGRGGEEAVALAEAGIPFRLVPGLTSGLAALTVASIPATMRGVNQALILVTGRCGEAADGIDWQALARTGQPIVLYMSLGNLGEIAGALMAGGLGPKTPVAVIASASLPAQRILVSQLGSVAGEVGDAGVEAPAIIAIGAVVAMRERLLALAARVPALVAE